MLVACYVMVRSLNLDLFVTTDEPFWLGRSANFYRALAHHDFAYTYQMAHPGVLTMWAGTIAYLMAFPDYTQYVTTNLRHVYGIGAVLREFGHDPMHLLVAARISKIMMQAAFFAISLGFLKGLFGRWVMVICGTFIVFDPFVSGMDSLLHVDGLFAIASFAAVLALAAASRSRPDAMMPWLVAGALAACAWMTRATGLVIIAVVAGIAIAQVYSRRREKRCDSWRSVLEAPAFAVMLWVSSAGAVSLLVLPALWVDPFGTMQQVWDWSSNAATEGHERPTFFLGEIHSGDPGLLFYPVTLVWRLTPVILLGALMCPILLPVGYRRGWVTRERMQAFAILAGFAVVYACVMSIGAKKFDRYILPVYPIIEVFAAAGVVLFGRWLVSLRPAWSRLALPLVAILFIAGQMLSLVSNLPYRLDYFNPVLGGLAHAEHSVQVGWGEGGGEAMDFVVDDAGGRDVIVQKSSVTPVLSYFATPNIHFDDFGLGTPAGWNETDYFIVGIQEWQRELSPSYQTMQRYDPAHIVEIEDVPFFKIYQPRELRLPDELRQPTGCSATFGDRAQLMQIIGREETIDFYWLDIDDHPRTLELDVALIAPEGPAESLPVQSTQLELAGPGKMSRATINDPRGEAAAPLDRYTLSIQIRDTSTGDILPVVVNGESVDGDAFLTRSECFYAESATP